MASLPSKVFIQVESPAEQQENIKNSRKVFNNLQKIGSITTDKENLLIGRSPAYIAKENLTKKSSAENELQLSQEHQMLKHKSPVPTTSKSSQTTINTVDIPTKQISAEDLTSEKPVNDRFWELLAEKRREALQETLVENQELYERIANLEEELNHSKNMLEEARDLVTVLTEMLEEKEEQAGPNRMTDTLASVETEDEHTDISQENLDLTI